jgi:L-aspartate oxidase
MAICDVLIIGSGIAGLSLAIKLNSQFPDRKIYIITKGDELESNTRYAQGGISAVCHTEIDSFEKHIEDTLKAGDGLCNRHVVEKVVRHAKHALADLTAHGVELDKDPNGNFALGREGGHSESRIVHYKDMTGFQIAVSLLVKVKTTPGIILLSNHAAIDLITDRQTSLLPSDASACYGAFVLNRQTMCVEKIISRVTVVATGGIGQVYRVNTNPGIATGDGIAMAHRAGASILNMEFIQFHPTAFYSGSDGEKFLISEALRGYGAFLKNCKGQRFMFKYTPEGELACRDVVARAIESEIKFSGHPSVFIDCTHLPTEQLKKDFPGIYFYCQKKRIDLAVDLIPVIPAAHYLCGGIEVDDRGCTSINNLYALGECTHTGLHGANRLASNSLLEAVAFAEFCFQDIRESINAIAINAGALEVECPFSLGHSDCIGLDVLKGKIQNLMTKYAGINRTSRGLKYALGYLELVDSRLDEFFPNTISLEILELRNILITAKLIVVQSLNRMANKGAFYNSDLDMECTLKSDKQGVNF